MIKYILFIILFTSTLFANIGKISAVTGDASVQRGNLNIVATLGMILQEKDIIQTKANAKLQIIFNDRTIVTIGKNSALDIQEYLYDTKNAQNSKVKFKFFKGAFKTVTGTIGKLNKKKFILQTKTSTIGIRGTVVIGNQSVIACTQGAIYVTANGIRVDVDTNQLTKTKENEAPTPAEPITNEAMKGLEEGFIPDQEKQDKETQNKNGNESNQNSDNKKDSNNNEEQKEENNDSDNKDGQNKDESTNSEQNDTNNQEEGESQNNNDGNTPPPNDEDAPPPEDDGTTPPPSSDDGTNPPSDSSTTSDSSFDPSLNDDGYLNEQPASTSDTTIDTSLPDSEVDTKTFDNPVTTEEDVPVPSELAMSGRILGYNSTTNMPGHSFSASRTAETLTFDQTGIDDLMDSDTFTRSGTKTFSSAFSSSYSTFDTSSGNLGTIEVNPAGLSYQVYGDSKGEVFALTYDQTAHKEMIIFGTDGSASSLSNGNVYMYTTFKELDVERENGTINTSKSDFEGSASSKLFYNAKLQSLTHFDKKTYEEGAGFFFAGNLTENNFFNHDYQYYDNSGTYMTYRTLDTDESNTINISLLGSESQAVMFKILEHSDSYNTEGSSQLNDINDMIGLAFLDKSVTKAATTGSKTLTGYVSYLHVDSSGANIAFTNSSAVTANDTITIAVDSDSGVIGNSGGTSQISFNGGNGVLKLHGTTSAQSAYYINDDLFGTTGLKTGSSYYDSPSTHLLDSNEDAMLIAVADGDYEGGTFKIFDSNDNPLFGDDDSSWGYWMADYGDSDYSNNGGKGDVHIDPKSAWVAGIETNTSHITSLMSTGSPQTFRGKVLGYANVADQIYSIDTVNSDVNLTINFGSGNNVTGSINFGLINNAQTWNMGIDSSNTISSSGFSGSFNTGGSGNFNGKFYGEGNEVNSVGGNFNAHNGSYNASGVFKAAKQ